MKKLVLITSLLLGISLVLAPVASAAGAPSIATAPSLSSGVQYVANFSEGVPHHRGTEFWKANLVSGDYFSLDGTQSHQARYFVVSVLPLSTGDANLQKNSPIVHSKLDTVLAFTALQTGIYPVEVTCLDAKICGIIKFFVDIGHELALYVPSSITLKRSGKFTVRVEAFGRRPVTSRNLIVNLYGLWKDNSAALTHHVLGSAEAKGGKAVIAYRLPAGLTGKKISLQATATGDGFLTASSSLCRARVT